MTGVASTLGGYDCLLFLDEKKGFLHFAKGAAVGRGWVIDSQ